MADILTNLAELFDYKEYGGDLDEKEYGLAILMCLQDFTKKYSSKSYNYIEKHFDEDCAKLEEKLLAINDKQFQKFEQATVKKELLKQNVPVQNQKKVNLKYDLQTTKQVSETTIKNAIQSLRNEIKLNIQVVKDRDSESDFNLEPKLKTAINRVKRSVEYATGMAMQKIKRSILRFKHGDEMLYKWQSAHLETTCGWCLHQETLPPRREEDWESDHLHGHCELVPMTEFLTDEYLELAFVDEDYFDEGDE